MTDREELKHSEADLSWCPFVHHKCHVTANSALACDQPATNRSSYDTDGSRTEHGSASKDKFLKHTHTQTQLGLSRERRFYSY